MSADSYRFAAYGYDALIERFNVKLKHIAMTLRSPEPGLRVLDLGCGTGVLLQLYAAQGAEVWGIDASPAMLAVARRRLGPTARLDEGDATRLPYPDDQFDLVTASMVLHEMAPATRVTALREAARVLRSDGEMLAIDYAVGPLRGPRGWPLRGLLETIEWLAGGDHYRGYRHFKTYGGLPALAAQLGWHTVQQRVVGKGNLQICLWRV